MLKKSYLLFLFIMIALFFSNISVYAQPSLLTSNYTNKDSNTLLFQYNYQGGNHYSPDLFSFNFSPASSSVHPGAYAFGASYAIPFNMSVYNVYPAWGQYISLPAINIGTWTQPTTHENYLYGTTQQMQEMQMSFNLQYLMLQNKISHENRQFTMISNIMKNKHDTAKNTINNIR